MTKIEIHFIPQPPPTPFPSYNCSEKVIMTNVYGVESMIFRKIYLTSEQYTIKNNLSVGDCISPSFSIIIKKSIFFYYFLLLLETDAINSLLFFKDVFLDWIPVFIYSILDIMAYFGAANLSDNCLKNFSRS